jgi:hypothetical protein
VIDRPWMQAHPRKDDVRRLAAESVLFVLGLLVIVVLIGLAGPA